MPRASSLARRRGFIAGIRVSQAIIAVTLLSGAAVLAGLNPLAEWWFWTAATAMITAAVAEPYYTDPVSAMLYGVAGFSAGLLANREGAEPLWSAYFVLAGSVVVAAVIAKVDQTGRAGNFAKWIATRFGRPAWLGIAAVAIELLGGVTARGLETTVIVALGVLLAVIVSVPDWYKFIIAARPGVGGTTLVEAAIEPNLLLVSASTRMEAGQLVQVEGRGKSEGVVVGNLAHKSGNRVHLALSNPWTNVVDASGGPVDITAVESTNGAVLGFAADGSTDRTLDLRALSDLTRGKTVYWADHPSPRKYLYQILGLDLRHEDWGGSAIIAKHATAGLLGVIDSTGISSDYQVPRPFAPVFSAELLSAVLPEGYERIGRIAGTNVPIGISVKSLREHHLGILGMSGMGKSTIARKVLHLLSVGGPAVAIDGTGEYVTKFGLTPWDTANGLTTNGESVFEPTSGSTLSKSSATQARDFIKDAMNAALVEYRTGKPRPRSILIEEAHAFLPEWNFVVERGESDIVAASCRMILQSRKYGLNFVLVSQRTAVINKSAISQCESYIILRTLDDTSLQYIESVAGSEFRDVASSLKRFQAICVGPAFSTSAPVIVDLDPWSELVPEQSTADETNAE